MLNFSLAKVKLKKKDTNRQIRVYSNIKSCLLGEYV